MKLTGILGKGSGKLGSSVFAISGGEQIVREYNPRVSNPKTDAQVEQRAKFKLISQLAATFAGCLGYKKDGLVSARNQFVSDNIKAATYADDKAKILLEKISLSGGAQMMNGIDLVATEQGVATVTVIPFESNVPDAVVVVVCDTFDENGLRVLSKQLLTTTDAQGHFVSAPVTAESNVAAYAYGIYFNENAKTDIFEDFESNNDDMSVVVSVIQKALASAATTSRTYAAVYPFS